MSRHAFLAANVDQFTILLIPLLLRILFDAIPQDNQGIVFILEERIHSQTFAGTFVQDLEFFVTILVDPLPPLGFWNPFV